MTIKRTKQVQCLLKQKQVMISKEENENLSETGERKLLEMAYLQQKWKTLEHAVRLQQPLADHSLNIKQHTHKGRKEDKTLALNEEWQINQKINPDGIHGRLLILANSVELLLESENISDRVPWNDQNHEEQKPLGQQIDGVDHASSETNGFWGQGKTVRLSQTRRHARSRSDLLVLQRSGDSIDGHLEGRRNRLTHIRHQARCKNNSELEDKEEKCLYNNPKGKTIRLSQIKCQARSK